MKINFQIMQETKNILKLEKNQKKEKNFLQEEIWRKLR